ncbi:MAG TPA: DUF177 domain-containing protein [Stellaceae bacterium]|nr:DUF177 domain-containing protein [Stellaceae bacterium]
MSDPAPEFSRRILLARLGHIPFRQEIVATDAECAALARRFELVSLDRLSAQVELTARGHDMFLLQAVFEAAFEQECVVTLDPVAGVIAAKFALLYGPPDAEESAIGPVDDDIAFEPIAGDTIDIGEAVAQEFSLGLPLFPRSPDAVIETDRAAPDDAGPFAALSRLRVGRDS